MMKAFTISEPFKTRIGNQEMPVAKKGESLLKTLYAGICGSDVAAFKGEQPFVTYPRIPGHEGVYEVVETDDEAKVLKAGDIVSVEPYFNCGKCYPCLHGRRNCCVENQTMGVHRNGVMAEYFSVPNEKIYKIGDNTDVDPSMSLTEPLGVAMHAVVQACITPLDNVFIVGAGPIGLCIAVLCRYYGAEAIITDIDPFRLGMAAKLGFEHAFIAGSEDGKQLVQKMTGKSGCDAVFEATGTPEGFMSAIEMAASSGRIVLVGNGKREVKFCHSVLLKKELRLLGSRNSQGCFPKIIDLLKTRKIDVKAIITHIIDFKDVERAFKMISDIQEPVGKVLIRFS